MYLPDVKKVDLKHSVIDEKLSDPKKGKYVFKKKCYVNYSKAVGRRPDYYLKWVRYEPLTQYREVRTWQHNWKASFVEVGDPFWPENQIPDSEGKYTFGDLVLMKVPMREYINKRKQEKARSDRATDAVKAKFRAEARKFGAEADDQLLADELGEGMKL